MTEETKKVDPNSPEGQVEENKQDNPKPPEDKTDYKALLEEEKAKKAKIAEDLEHSRHANEKKKAKIEELKNEPAPALDTDEIVNKLDAKAKEREDKRFMEQQKDFIETTITNMSTDPSKQELIRLKYENSIKKTGFSKEAILEDLSSAVVLVDKNKIIGENKELKNTLIQKKSTSNSGMGSNQDKPNPSDYKPTDEDKRIADKYFKGDLDRYLKTKN